MTVTPIYTAAAHASGGRDGKASIHGSDLSFDLDPPKEMGGAGNGANPEQLFAAGYAACFIGAMKFATTHDSSLTKVPDGVSVESEVGIGPNAAGGFALVVSLSVSMPGLTTSDAQRIVDAGHKICPYSNAVRGNVTVTTEIQ